MNTAQSLFSPIIAFFADTRVRRVLYLLAISALSISAAMESRYVRRTFVFYGVKEGDPRVEEHMLLKSLSEEDALAGYAEETLFGPRTPECAPLFAEGTSLRALLWRPDEAGGVLYINLSEDAAFPTAGGLERGFSTFRESIIRNFPFVNDIQFFIEGNSVPF
jgi:hypothetical protein